MQKKNVFITNDDGAESPLLNPFIEAVDRAQWSAKLLVVTPKEEQSWTSYALHREKELTAERRSFGSYHGFTIDGYPADCTSIGISHLGGAEADLVLSGINFGINTGVPFFLCSGTVGAAVQGFLMGRKAIALSAHIPPELFVLKHNPIKLIESYQSHFEEIAEAATIVIGKIIASNVLDEVDILSVNIPWSKPLTAEVKVCALERGSFKHLFVKSGDNTFKHHLQLEDLDIAGPPPELGLPGDFSTVEEGFISVTPITFSFTKKGVIDFEKLERSIAISS